MANGRILHVDFEIALTFFEMTTERWTPRQCHDYFENRPWDPVLRFYEQLVRGEASMRDLIIFQIDPELCCGSEDSEHTPPNQASIDTYTSTKDLIESAESFLKVKAPRWERRTFKLVVRYSGKAFAGWQKQPGFVTVQSVLEKALGSFVDGKRARLLEEQGKMKEALVSVAGRTDKGVHAAGQVCSFYTWMNDCKPEDVEEVVNSAMPMALQVISAAEVDRDFHPVFSAKWRRYVYILPLNRRDEIDVKKVDGMLRALEGHCLSYAIFARDTKSSRSSGPATLCTLYHARAAIGELPRSSNEEVNELVMVVELVADRFLRKMVRVLVSTAVREVAAGAASDALLFLTRNCNRKASAPPALAQGLCLAEVGYEKLRNSSLLLSSK